MNESKNSIESTKNNKYYKFFEVDEIIRKDYTIMEKLGKNNLYFIKIIEK
jgi:hypothetical protein